MPNKMEIKTVETRYGEMSFYEGDGYVGLSLETYGEFAENEVLVMKKVLRKGDTGIDCGAHIGGLTIPMAELVGKTGRVIAFEPGKANAKLLRRNAAQTGNNHIEVYEFAAFNEFCKLPISHNPSEFYPKVNLPAGNGVVEYIKAMPIDSLELDQCRFMKIDVDGCEQQTIEGASNTILRCRPVIYIENEIPDKAEKLVATIVELGYRCFSFTPPLFSEKNWNNVAKNIFPTTVATMMICIPEESDLEVKGCVEITDVRMNDDLMFDREAERYERIAALKPDDLTARLLAAHNHALMQRMERSDELIKENFRRNPEHLATKAVEGLHLLQRGEWKEGWKRYELRYSQANARYFGGDRKPKDMPIWDGKPTDEPVLVWCEQGYGDTIMFSRLYKYAKERAPNAILEVQAELFELFDYSRIEPSGRLYRMGRELPDLYGQQCAVPSLPFVLGVEDDSMLKIDKPYLFADPVLTSRFTRLGCKVGICAKGSPRSERPYTRDIPFEKLVVVEKECGQLLQLNNENGQFYNFMATAAAINSLDLVITVDTSIAHLAGAMGKETWLLLAWDPDFRWGLKGDSCIWYPSMRIFRQRRFRDWDGVMEEVIAALRERKMKVAA